MIQQDKTRQREERKTVHAVGVDRQRLETLQLQESELGEAVEGRNAEGKRDETGQIGAEELGGLVEGEAAKVEGLERLEMFDLHEGGAIKRVGVKHVLIVSDKQVGEQGNVCRSGKTKRKD